MDLEFKFVVVFLVTFFGANMNRCYLQLNHLVPSNMFRFRYGIGGKAWHIVFLSTDFV